jgi:hypothetical protein
MTSGGSNEMEYSYATSVLYHYGRRYVERVGEMPRAKDLDPVLARTLLGILGDVSRVIDFLDTWFGSSDPWYQNEGFELQNAFMAINRLFAQGEIEPKGGRSDRQDLARKLAVELFLKPKLYLVPKVRP